MCAIPVSWIISKEKTLAKDVGHVRMNAFCLGVELRP